MIKVLIGNGGHAREVMAQMGCKLDRFVDEQYVDDDTQPLGSFIGAYSILTTNIKIGKHSILNRGNHIGHDCRIGDYFSAMPGAIVSGNVTIYSLVYMGSNSSIREKLSVHSLATIGMNSAVVKHIEEGGVYVGCPVKKIK